MILIDANLLIYAVNKDAPPHRGQSVAGAHSFRTRTVGLSCG